MPWRCGRCNKRWRTQPCELSSGTRCAGGGGEPWLPLEFAPDGAIISRQAPNVSAKQAQKMRRSTMQRARPARPPTMPPAASREEARPLAPPARLQLCKAYGQLRMRSLEPPTLYPPRVCRSKPTTPSRNDGHCFCHGGTRPHRAHKSCTRSSQQASRTRTNTQP